MAKKKAKDGTDRGANGKYTQELADSIIQKVETGKHTIAAICESEGIHISTLYDWLDKPELSEFSEAFKVARKARRKNIGDMAETGLATLVKVTEYEEETIEYKSMPVMIEYPDGRKETQYKPQIAGKKVVKKKVMPNARAVEFALTNVLPEDYKNMRHIDHTTKGKELNDHSSKSTDELIKRAKALEKIEGHEESQVDG